MVIQSSLKLDQQVRTMTNIQIFINFIIIFWVWLAFNPKNFKMITYKNKNGLPMLRSCYNCINFKEIENLERTGYCQRVKLMFAYTLQSNVHPMVKTFYLCQDHEFSNENALKLSAEQVSLENSIRKVV